MSDIHGQPLVPRLDETDRIAAGKPGQTGAKNIEYRTLRDQISTDLGVGIFRVPLSAIDTEISIPELPGIEYEIEVVFYRTNAGEDGKDIVVINQKTTTSFHVVLPSVFENGVFIYRILNFN